MISIKNATADDTQVLYDLILAIADYHQQTQYVTTSVEKLRQALSQSEPKFGALLAYSDNQLAGYASYTWTYSIWRGESFLNLDDLFVWQQFRGQKIGQALMHKTKAVSLENQVVRMRWEVAEDNQSAIEFYKQLGARIEHKGVCYWEFGNKFKI